MMAPRGVLPDAASHGSASPALKYVAGSSMKDFYRLEGRLGVITEIL